MATRTVVARLGNRLAASQRPATVRRASVVSSGLQYFHSSAQWQQVVQSNPTRGKNPNPIAASMANSTTPTGEESNEDRAKHAAFLGEADSDDGFEADIEINPEAHRHKFDDVNASGLHGQAGEGDEPIETERKPQEAIDAEHAAFLGEADSDDAHETDRDLNPEKYRHNIEDASPSGIHGESGHGDEQLDK